MKKRSVLTIGVFDGVHRGHGEVIKRVVRRAKALGAQSIVITFEPHPLKVLRPSSRTPSLISLKHRIRLMKGLGVDRIIVIRFTKSVSTLDPETFVRNVLIDKLGVREIFIGENFYFGRGAAGGPGLLKNISRKSGFKVRVVKPLRVDGDIVSSTAIRTLIAKGDIVRASKYLGRPVAILGTVVSGSRLARKLGYPTANIDPHHEAIPPSGVYAVKVIYKKKAYKGVLNIGTRPTIHGYSRRKEPVIEAHIFNFHKKIYGRDLEILFIKRLRREARFRDLGSLVAQIKRDETAAKKALQFTADMLI